MFIFKRTISLHLTDIIAMGSISLIFCPLEGVAPPKTAILTEAAADLAKSSHFRYSTVNDADYLG